MTGLILNNTEFEGLVDWPKDVWGGMRERGMHGDDLKREGGKKKMSWIQNQRE